MSITYGGRGRSGKTRWAWKTCLVSQPGVKLYVILILGCYEGGRLVPCLGVSSAQPGWGQDGWARGGARRKRKQPSGGDSGLRLPGLHWVSALSVRLVAPPPLQSLVPAAGDLTVGDWSWASADQGPCLPSRLASPALQRLAVPLRLLKPCVTLSPSLLQWCWQG